MLRRPRARRAALVALIALVGCAVVLLLPVASRLTRLAGVVSVVTLFIASLVLWWRRPLLRWSMIATVTLLAVFLALPARRLDAQALRAADVAALKRYEGAFYVWGGEGPVGIDCSGLVRRGLIDALAIRSVTTLDPGAARLAIATWWRDCTARALGEGHAGLTRPVLEAASINAIDTALIAPGDLAVASDGVHVLAYLGDGEWIQADPAVGHVLTLRAPSSDSPWFHVPVRVVRWRALDA
jgi:hypothetical protein